MRAIITVLDSINQTTMPYNEFILYRNNHYKNEKQIVFLTGDEIAISSEDIPRSLEIHKIGKNPLKIHRELKKIINKLRRENIEYIVHLHSIRGSFSTFIGMLGTSFDSHTVYTVHSTFSGYRIYNKIFSSINALFSQYVTFVSNVSYSSFPNVLKKIKDNRFRVIKNGVNLERINKVLPDITKRKHEGIICTYVARMVPLKNHKFLINVLKATKENIKFIFVGEEEIQDVRKYAKQMGVIDRIIFTGLIPREKVYEVLVNSDIYISSSTLEGLPISVLEGMYCGLPVILSNIPQHRELIDNIDEATIVDFNIKAWRDSLEHFSKMSDEERYVIGQKCKQHIEEKFSLKRMHFEYDQIYSEIINQIS